MQLSRYINHLNENLQKTDPYELAFWNKIMLPLSTAVMVVLAVPFVFTNVRSGTLGRNLFIGIMLGIGFYVANKGFEERFADPERGGYFTTGEGHEPLIARMKNLHDGALPSGAGVATELLPTAMMNSA